MWFTFEQALRKKCEQNPDLSLLVSQWEYDRRLVADALQSVVSVVTYFEWTARHAKGGPKPESEIARVLWDFVCMIDSLMEGHWEKAYDLKIAKHELRRWLK